MLVLSVLAVVLGFGTLVVLLIRGAVAEAEKEYLQAEVVNLRLRSSEITQLAGALRASMTRKTAGSAADITVMGKELSDRLYLEGGSSVLLYRVAALVDCALSALQALNKEAANAVYQLVCEATQPDTDQRGRERRRSHLDSL